MPGFLAPPVATLLSIPTALLGSFLSSVPRGAYGFYAFEDHGGENYTPIGKLLSSRKTLDTDIFLL
jgi:hypothetical protein